MLARPLYTLQLDIFRRTHKQTDGVHLHYWQLLPACALPVADIVTALFAGAVAFSGSVLRHRHLLPTAVDKCVSSCVAHRCGGYTGIVTVETLQAEVG
jgi:hypothetical protein